jgi:hypothetical protein
MKITLNERKFDEQVYEASDDISNYLLSIKKSFESDSNVIISFLDDSILSSYENQDKYKFVSISELNNIARKTYSDWPNIESLIFIIENGYLPFGASFSTIGNEFNSYSIKVKNNKGKINLTHLKHEVVHMIEFHYDKQKNNDGRMEQIYDGTKEDENLKYVNSPHEINARLRHVFDYKEVKSVISDKKYPINQALDYIYGIFIDQSDDILLPKHEKRVKSRIYELIVYLRNKNNISINESIRKNKIKTYYDSIYRKKRSNDDAFFPRTCTKVEEVKEGYNFIDTLFRIYPDRYSKNNVEEYVLRFYPYSSEGWLYYYNHPEYYDRAKPIRKGHGEFDEDVMNNFDIPPTKWTQTPSWMKMPKDEGAWVDPYEDQGLPRFDR